MIEVVIPWQRGDPDRLRALHYIAARWGQVTIGELPIGVRWSKAAAIERACPTAEILVISDADVWCDGVPEAVTQVEARGGWAIPHDRVYRLDRDGTDAFMSGAEVKACSLSEPSYRGTAGGGIVVMSRATYEDCPLDPRFVGWGQEDESWEYALTTLHGKPWRGKAPLAHLWHPPMPRVSRRHGSKDGMALRRQYQAANRNQRAMREVVNAAKAGRTTI